MEEEFVNPFADESDIASRLAAASSSSNNNNSNNNGQSPKNHRRIFMNGGSSSLRNLSSGESDENHYRYVYDDCEFPALPIC